MQPLTTSTNWLAWARAKAGWPWAAEANAGWLGLRETANKQQATINNNGISGKRQSTRNKPHTLETWTSVPK